MRRDAFKVGVAKVKITPKGREFLAGFNRNRISEGVHDDLYIRAVIIGDKSDKLALVSADLIGLFKDYTGPIREHIERTFNIKRSHIICCCTHTHSGPDTIGLWGPDCLTSGLNELYMRRLKEKFILAIYEALRNMQEAIIEYSWKWIEPRGIVRNTRDPHLVDRYLAVIRIRNLEEKSIATIVNFACHPEVLDNSNKLITSDYPYYLREYLENKLGGLAIFFNGALGGMLTPDVRLRSFSEAKKVGEKLGEEAIKALNNAHELEYASMKVRYSTFKIPQRNEIFKNAFMRGLIKRRIFNDYIETEINLIHIGEISIASLPGEALPRVGMELRGGMNSRCKLILGLANDEIGYIIPSDAWDASKYEESMSLGSETADIILNEFYRLMARE